VSLRQPKCVHQDHLRENLELSDRTCHNRFEHLLTFLKANGIEKLAKKRDWPKHVETEPESYTDEELAEFFAACAWGRAGLFRVLSDDGIPKERSDVLRMAGRGFEAQLCPRHGEA
jgi:hypothetical protein